MLRKINELRTQKGSMMVEAIAMLGLISMVTPVIYKKAAERTNEMQDINAASQVRTIVNAIDNYLRDNYVTITSGGTVTSNSATSDKSVNYGDFNFGASDSDTTAKTTTPINIEHFRDYLPLGFKAQGKMFEDFQVVIKQTRDPSGERKALTTVMVAKPNAGNPDMSRIRSSRIASMIGTNGGFYDGEKATGVQGVWEIDKADLPDSSGIADGSIVATSLEAVADGTAGGKNVLHRVEVPGRPEYNTMETTLSMAGNDINQIVNLIAAGNANNNTINIKAQTGEDNALLHVDGEGLIDSTLKAAEENFIAESGYAQHKQALYVGTGNTEDDAQFLVKGDIGSIKALSGKFNVNKEGTTPYVKLTGNNGKTVLNANEGLVSFMEQNVMISPEGNTDIAGYTHITGDISAANDGFTANDTEAHFYDETLNILDTRDVNIGTEAKNANLRVHGNATIDNLNVEKNFKAGHITGSDKYGLNVAETTGNVTVNSQFVVNYNNGATSEKVFDVNNTLAKATVAKQFVAGRYDATRGGIGLAADESGATVRFKDAGSSFLVKDANDKNQIESKQGYTKFATNDQQVAKFYAAADNKTQAQFTADVAVYDGTQNILTVSQSNENGTAIDNGRGTIHMRKGVIEIDRNGNAENNKSDPIGYIKADRLVSNVANINGVSPDRTGGEYSFEVNPAYTSMMNDIKLASRGGARLSDILPDFINKGIYVLDNTYEGNVNWADSGVAWDSDGKLTGLSNCEDMSCDTSPWLGFIPTPNCPPGYAQVATITPIRFAMAQAGVPVTNSDKDEDYRDLNFRADPRGDKLSVGMAKEGASSYTKISSPLVIVTDNDPTNPNGGMNYAIDGAQQSKPPYWAEMINTPYTFQINTWLSTTLKAYSKGDKFQGWHGIMGFIYPAKTYEEYARSINAIATGATIDSNSILWNLFPVRREELSAIATIYCYFDREKGGFSTTYVDSYLPHKHAIGSIRYQEKTKGEVPNYNDPNLNYNTLW